MPSLHTKKRILQKRQENLDVLSQLGLHSHS